jgi:hypothetical protein
VFSFLGGNFSLLSLSLSLMGQPTTTEKEWEEWHFDDQEKPSIQPQIALSIWHSAKARTMEGTQSLIRAASHYMTAFPSIKLFAYSAGALSVIPVGIFVVVISISLVISLSTASKFSFLFLSLGRYFVSIGCNICITFCSYLSGGRGLDDRYWYFWYL